MTSHPPWLRMSCRSSAEGKLRPPTLQYLAADHSSRRQLSSTWHFDKLSETLEVNSCSSSRSIDCRHLAIRLQLPPASVVRHITALVFPLRTTQFRGLMRHRHHKFPGSDEAVRTGHLGIHFLFSRMWGGGWSKELEPLLLPLSFSPHSPFSIPHSPFPMFHS